jgi:hypothetical protein
MVALADVILMERQRLKDLDGIHNGCHGARSIAKR